MNRDDERANDRTMTTPVVKRSLVLAMLAMLATLAACSSTSIGSSGSSYGRGDPTLAAANPMVGGAIDPFLSDGHAVLEALDAIESRVGKPLRITRLEADQIHGLTVDVQVPAHRDEVDQYVVAVDGTLTGPAPVKIDTMSGKPVTAADVNAETFDRHAVGIAHLESTIRQAIAKSHAADARVVDWEYAGGESGRKYAYLDSARTRPIAVLGNHFELLRVQF
jgi:hypothetical protein